LEHKVSNYISNKVTEQRKLSFLQYISLASMLCMWQGEWKVEKIILYCVFKVKNTCATRQQRL